MTTARKDFHTRHAFSVTGKGMNACLWQERVRRRRIGGKRDALVGGNMHVRAAGIIGKGFALSWS